MNILTNRAEFHYSYIFICGSIPYKLVYIHCLTNRRQCTGITTCEYHCHYSLFVYFDIAWILVCSSRNEDHFHCKCARITYNTQHSTKSLYGCAYVVHLIASGNRPVEHLKTKCETCCFIYEHKGNFTTYFC